MIRFGAIVSVVAAAIGLLVAGAVSGDLSLVYVSIGLAAFALLMLVVGVAVWRDRVFGGASAPAPGARPDAYAAGVARSDTARRPEPAAHGEAALAEPGGLAGQRKTADPRAGRQAPGAVAAQGARLPVGDAGDWTVDPGPRDRDKREQPAREWPARPSAPQGRPSPQARPAPEVRPAPHVHTVPQGPPSPQGQPTRVQAPQGQPTRPPVPHGTPARPPRPPDQPVWGPAGTGQPVVPDEAVTSSKAAPGRSEPSPAGTPDIGPADDPTRLARRLGTAAELSRQPGPSTTQTPDRRTSANPRPADPLTGPPPAAAGASGRTRLQKEAAAAAAAKSPVPPVADPDPQAKAASAKSQQDSGQGDTAAGSTGTDLAEQPAIGNGDARNRPTPGAELSTSEVDTSDVSTAGVSTAGRAAPDAESSTGAVAEADSAKGAVAEADSAKGAVPGVDADEATGPEATSPEPTSTEATGADGTDAEAVAPEGAAAEANGSVSGDTTVEAGGLVSVVPGIARYHLPDCILIRFLSAEDLETMTRQAAEASGCIPCRACRPDKAAADD